MIGAIAGPRRASRISCAGSRPGLRPERHSQSTIDTCSMCSRMLRNCRTAVEALLDPCWSGAPVKGGR